MFITLSSFDNFLNYFNEFSFSIILNYTFCFYLIYSFFYPIFGIYSSNFFINKNEYSSKLLNLSTPQIYLMPETSHNKNIMLVIILLALVFFSWRGYTFNFFFGHLSINLNVLRFFSLSIFLFFSAFIIFIKSNRCIAPQFSLILSKILMLILVLNLPLLVSATNFYSSVVIIEFLSSLLFLIIILNVFSIYNDFNIFNFSKIITALISFFWVNTLVSACLFIYLIYIKFSWFTWDYTLPIFVITPPSWYRIDNFLIVYLLIITIFLKCGLPPMLIWKCLLFSITPVSFIGFYIINYYSLIFIFILKLLSVYIFQNTFNYLCSWDLMSFLLIIMLAAVVLASFWSFNYSDWGVFFAISSLFTTSFLLTIHLILLLDYRTAFDTNNNLISYLLMYVIINLILFFLICNFDMFTLVNLVFNFTYRNITSTLLWLNQTGFSKNLVLIIFICLASLPPTTQFIIKLFLISRLQLFHLYAISPIILLYLFLMLIFYFRNSKTILIDYTTSRINYTGNQFHLTNTYNFNIFKFQQQVNSSLGGFLKIQNFNYIAELTLVIVLLLTHTLLLSLSYLNDVFLLNWSLFN
uniref:NADH dehydrogenase subunit 2 n=1 Tax=Euplotes vanleeuwenhoeki TaxID=2794224 RepID=A0A7T1FUQ4_9SPIT|nr:hypothetical protein KQ443_mgp28 [Euplotes vanleeuwenhoeki]QPM99250.1 hypothetical protein MitoLV_22 [Euplotes vanleeuwenhoeki]